MIAEGVKVYEDGGRKLGDLDLDLIAVDPRAGRGVILELKWPIDAVTLAEIEKTDKIVLDGVRQLARCRRALQDGTGTAKLPPAGLR